MNQMTLKEEFKRLPHQAREVIELRYGFRDGVPRKHQEIAEELALFRKMVRRMEQKGLYNLRWALIEY